jgi:hypothetical protein
MPDFLATLKGPSAIAMLMALAIAVVTGAVVISSLVGRVEKLEATIAELAASTDHPRLRLLDTRP